MGPTTATTPANRPAPQATGPAQTPAQQPDSPLRRARNRAGLTVTTLSTLSSVPERTIRNLEHHPARQPRILTRHALANALDQHPHDIWPTDQPIPAPPSRITWPPIPDDLTQAVEAYRAAGDAAGAGDLLGYNQETIRQRLNQAGCQPRPRGGSNRDNIQSLASWARKRGIPIHRAIQAAQTGRVPGAFIEHLDDPIIGCRWAVQHD